MNIEYVPDYEALSQSGANVVKACIEKSPKGLFCLATGYSPKGLYQYLSQDPTFDGQGIKVLALDEWLGLEQNHPSTCHYYLNQNVFTPWGISKDNQFTFNAQTQAPEAECLRLRSVLETYGPIKLCILGLGRNGHLGLNEPGETLQAHAHVAQLEPLSQRPHA